jgi:hypothetical protein
MLIRSAITLCKVYVTVLLLSSSVVFAFGSSERINIEPNLQLQINPCAEFGPTVEQQCNMGLINAANQIFDPPAAFVQSDGRSPVGVMSLPAVPAGIFMALCGLICVLFVKEHKILLVTLAYLFWAGQFGINAIPKLVLRLTERNNRQIQSAKLHSKYYLDNFSGFPRNVTGTRYMGLLHYLAGIIVDEGSLKGFNQNVHGQRACRFDSISWQVGSIISSQAQDLLSSYRIKKTEQFFCFSPAFIFNSLARGPPELNQKKNF